MEGGDGKYDIVTGDIQTDPIKLSEVDQDGDNVMIEQYDFCPGYLLQGGQIIKTEWR